VWCLLSFANSSTVNIFKIIESNLKRIIDQVLESIVAVVVNGKERAYSDVQVSEEYIATGFYIDKSTVVTVSHVSRNSDTKKLCLVSLDGEVYKGTVTSVDEDNDTMFIATERDMKPLKIESALVSEGAIVFSSGIAQGILRRFITMGVVSGLEVKAVINNREIEGLILLNMPTIPGMSGAPLIDVDGNVIGMILSRSFLYNEFSLALPSTRVLLDYMMLKKLGRIVHIKLGLKLLQSPNVLKKLGLKNGLVVTEITNKTLLKNCEIFVGDIITEVNGEKVTALEDFRKAVLHSFLNGIGIELNLFSQRGGIKKCYIDINSSIFVEDLKKV
jgi:S1-C subfamily serine protease